MKQHEPLVGEPLALDLVNTRPADADLLDTPQALHSWLALEAERFPELAAVAAPTGAALAAVLAVRAGVTAVVDALLTGRPAPPEALEALNAAQRAAPTVTRLAAADGGLVAVTEYLGAADDRLASHLAKAAADLLASAAIGKLRQCEADDCRLVFLLSHPKRRWCSAERCGNRVRVARYYRQNKKTG
jgi:predicted RNA-binding Zn ribbon-like protein